MAVQIAKTLGAEVTGVCGSRNTELVRSLGAGHLIDYTKEDFTQSRQRFDVILDNVLNHPPKAAARVLAPNGTFIPDRIGCTGGLLAGLPRTARAVLMGLGPANVRLVTPATNRENLAALRRLLESGEVKVVIAQTYPLGQAATAITHMLEHHPSGKIAITVQRQQRRHARVSSSAPSRYQQPPTRQPAPHDRRDGDDTAQATPAPVSTSEQARQAPNAARPPGQTPQPEPDPDDTHR
jgi:Zinc-binding dehydrogenase